MACLMADCSPEVSEERLAKFRLIADGEPARESNCCTKSSAESCHGEGVSCCAEQEKCRRRTVNRSVNPGAAKLSTLLADNGNLRLVLKIHLQLLNDFQAKLFHVEQFQTTDDGNDVFKF